MKNRDINFDDLCNLIALEVGNTSVDSVKRYLRAIYKVILSQLEINGRIYFKGFGYWEVKERKSGEREINDPKKGGKRLVYVKPKNFISFKPSVNFTESVNEGGFKILTKEKAKKLANKKDYDVTATDLINRANSRMKRKEQ